jgi:hypothetical protein
MDGKRQAPLTVAHTKARPTRRSLRNSHCGDRAGLLLSQRRKEFSMKGLERSIERGSWARPAAFLNSTSAQDHPEEQDPRQFLAIWRSFHHGFLERSSYSGCLANPERLKCSEARRALPTHSGSPRFRKVLAFSMAEERALAHRRFEKPRSGRDRE